MVAMTAVEISDLLDVAPSTITNWLCGYRFNKFMLPQSQFTFNVNEEFISVLIEFLKCKAQKNYKIERTLKRCRLLKRKLL